MRPLLAIAALILAGCQVQPVYLLNKTLISMNITIVIFSFAAGIAAAFYAPKLWTAAKAWIVAKLS